MKVENRILTKPRQVAYHDGPPVVLGRTGQAECCVRIEDAGKDAEMTVIAGDLEDRLAGLLADRPRGEAACPPETTRITLQIGAAPAGIANADQGYAITVTDGEISLTGYGIAGLRYAVTSFIQCLGMENNLLTIPRLSLLDWPDMRTRGHFMESRYGSNLMTLADWQHVVDHMAAMKMNQLVVSLYGCWCVQYDGRVSEYLYVPLKSYEKLKTPVVIRYYSPAKGEWIDREQLPPMFEQDFFGDLVAYGKRKGVTVFPLFNSYGHNTLIPAQYPEISAKDENGEPTLTGYCTSNPDTYKMLFDIYDQIIDRYLAPNGVDSFHIGLDEVGDGIAQNADDVYKVRSPWCRCPDCAGQDRIQRFIGHAVKLVLHLKQRGMKHIYLYHDMLIAHGTYGETDSCGLMMDALRQNDLLGEVVIDWWTYSDFQESLMFQTTRPELGLRRTVKPWNGYYHWTMLSHPLQNIYLLAKMGYEEGVEGMQSYSAWDESYDRNHLAQACYAWNYLGTGAIADFRNHYARSRFGPAWEQAAIAFALLEQAAASNNRTYADGTPVINRLSLLQHDLSYYFYSYVQTGKPYPRLFPGEALRRLSTRRDEVAAALNEIAVLAGEAGAIFRTLADRGGESAGLARRFAYEAANYRCLAEDYLTLFHMADLAEQLAKSREEALAARIRDLAGERKEARLRLMALLERTKEPFLLASHMRNQAIFMQYFADLESYLARVNLAEIKLDFFDNTHFASQAFWNLR